MAKDTKKELTLADVQQTKLGKVGFFRFKKLDPETYVIVNDAGRFSYLTVQEFADFNAGKITQGPKYIELAQKWFIQDENYAYHNEMRVAKRHTYLGFGPALHIIVLTLRCNHACRYCHASSVPVDATGMDMTEETAKKVIDAIYQSTSPGLTIEFQGGEPTLNWDVLKFCVEYAEKKAEALSKETIFTVVTNLSTMNEEMLEYCAEHKVKINTSLDGDKETHDYNRVYGNQSSYDLVTQWIEKVNFHIQNDPDARLRKMMGNSLGAMITVTKKSLKNWKACVDAYVKYDMKEIYWRPLNPYGFGAVTFDEIGYTVEEFIENYRQVMDYIIEINLGGKRLREVYAATFIAKIFTGVDPNHMDIRSPCGAGIGQVAYNYDGKIYTCDEGRMLARMGIDHFQIGQVEESGIRTYQGYITSPTTRTMVAVSTTEGAPGFDDYVYKPYTGICPIHNFKTLGNIYANFSMDRKRKLEEAIIDIILDKARDPAIKQVFLSWLRPGMRKES